MHFLKPDEETYVKPVHSKFQKHVRILVWKCYQQRQRRWRILVVETVFAFFLFVSATLIAKPVFLTPLEIQPEPPLAFSDLLESLPKDMILGFAPNESPYLTIMSRAAELLGSEILSAEDENKLNLMLYNRSKGNKKMSKVTWILWSPKDENLYKVSIKSTEVAHYLTKTVDEGTHHNPHLRAGFIAVQLAVSQALLEHVSPIQTEFELSLVSMPVSPLMEEKAVRRVISLILLCFTLALLPPVLETEAIVVSETTRKFKRALRIRNVEFSTIYISWLTYAFLTATPICFLGSITLILIFRWIHLVPSFMALLIYVCTMVMLAMIMAMFHTKAKIAWLWSTLQTILQTFLAELMVQHDYASVHPLISFVLHMFLPPLGLLNGLNQFAMLQTKQKSATTDNVFFTIGSWVLLILIYFQILMLIQRTLGSHRAIGGQVSWKTIIFRKPEDENKLRPILAPTWYKRDVLQEVDGLAAKAVTFKDVAKSVMDVMIVKNLTLDIYRGELTFITCERIQEEILFTMEDLLIGIAKPDRGTIHVLGVDLSSDRNLLTEQLMMGYLDNTSFLIPELTVEEHLILFIELSLWNQSNSDIWDYTQTRLGPLLNECDLVPVKDKRISRLGVYYLAQLCWAIAILLEPKIVVIPYFVESSIFRSVLKDKVLMYHKSLTLVKLSRSSDNIEHCDRIFLLDNKVLAFGGTPAYMFFKYGREYRFRLTLKVGTNKQDTEELVSVLVKVGASVRAHLGSLLLFRIPTSPSHLVASLVKHIEKNSKKYGVISMNISLPDPEEIFRRSITESRTRSFVESPSVIQKSQAALDKLAQPKKYLKLRRTRLLHYTHLRAVAWKYITFYVHYRFYAIVAVVSAIVAGIFIGLSLASMFRDDLIPSTGHKADLILEGEVLTVEARNARTILAMRLDNTTQARKLAEGYIMSQTNSNKTAMEKMEYMALAHTESLREYLVTRAIDSPVEFVDFYAYGMEIQTNEDETFNIQALYSPMHRDAYAAVRSLARVYMALLRYYTDTPDASIEIVDNPLVMDLLPANNLGKAPLLIQFLLVLTISHIVLLPSKEAGFIRHYQKHAYNFSPACYWFLLAVCDFVFYWLLTVLMAAFACVIVYLTISRSKTFGDFMMVPLVLLVYGIGCIPQVYLFSLGRRTTLNCMAVIVVNVVFGEATIIAKVFYGDVYNYAMNFMYFSPQFNMAYAFVKIQQIFFHNTECTIFDEKNLCKKKILHKCCEKCGVLQECFKRKSFLLSVMPELAATMLTAVLFMTILLMWEYRWIQKIFMVLMACMYDYSYDTAEEIRSQGAIREEYEVQAKESQMMSKKQFKRKARAGVVDTFGEYLLAAGVSLSENNEYVLRNVYLGLSKGETLALAGLKRHGRQALCEVLAGYKFRSDGRIWAMSKYRIRQDPHNYCRHVSFSCFRPSLPHWMAVYDALGMIALLRGVPLAYIKEEIETLLDALDLSYQGDLLICHLQPNETKRLNFAAAVLGAPPIIILDECTAYQNPTVRRAMYEIIYFLKKQGHAIIHSAANLESHMPVSNRLAIIRDGQIFDTDYVDNMLERYQNKGYTVVVHLKDEVLIKDMFQKYFKVFKINDTTEVLANVQVYDDFSWTNMFSLMEQLLRENEQVYSYIICATPIDYIYNSILVGEKGTEEVNALFLRQCWKYFYSPQPKIQPPIGTMNNLRRFEPKYDIVRLKELPWSVIFQR